MQHILEMWLKGESLVVLILILKKKMTVKSKM